MKNKTDYNKNRTLAVEILEGVFYNFHRVIVINILAYKSAVKIGVNKDDTLNIFNFHTKNFSKNINNSFALFMKELPRDGLTETPILIYKRESKLEAESRITFREALANDNSDVESLVAELLDFCYENPKDLFKGILTGIYEISEEDISSLFDKLFKKELFLKKIMKEVSKDG